MAERLDLAEYEAELFRVRQGIGRAGTADDWRTVGALAAADDLLAEVRRLRAAHERVRAAVAPHREPHALKPIELTHLAGRVEAALDGREYDR